MSGNGGGAAFFHIKQLLAKKNIFPCFSHNETMSHFPNGIEKLHFILKMLEVYASIVFWRGLPNHTSSINRHKHTHTQTHSSTLVAS